MKIQEIYRGTMCMAAVALLSGAVASAQMAPRTPEQNTPNATTPGNNPGMTDGGQPNGQDPASAMKDKAFLREAMEGGMAEVQLGQLAAQKASSDDVKQFGQKMVDDHTKLNDQIKPIAEQMGVQPPSELSKKDMELMNKLQGLSGTQFDEAYIKAMVKDHKKDNQEFKMEASQTQNSTLQQAVQQGDQVIQEHLHMIEQIAQAHNLSMGKGKMSSGQ